MYLQNTFGNATYLNILPTIERETSAVLLSRCECHCFRSVGLCSSCSEMEQRRTLCVLSSLRQRHEAHEASVPSVVQVTNAGLVVSSKNVEVTQCREPPDQHLPTFVYREGNTVVICYT